MLDIGHRVHRRAPELPHSFGDAVHPVDVGLTELPAVGVDWESTTDLDGTVGDEVLRFSPPAESQLLQLNQGERGEVVVEDRSLDVRWLQAGLRPQLLTYQAHLW